MSVLRRGRQRREIEREVRFKQGVARIRAYIQTCQQVEKQLWELGKRALELGDRQQFETIARAYLRTGDAIAKWERCLIAMDTLSVQRDHARATAEFARSVGALGDSIMEGAKPEEITKIQTDIEQALTKAQTLEDTLGAVLNITTDTLFSVEELSQGSLQEVEAAMRSEAAGEATGVSNDRISQGLRRIEEAMRKDSR